MLLAVPLLAMMPVPSSSFYPVRLEDSKAIDLGSDRFPVKGDGVADDADMIQAAIDAVGGQGIVFVPEGRYRLSKTVTVWPGVRVVGYGAHRPTFLLGANTPGYQTTERLMVFFAGRRGKAEEPPIPEGARGGDFGLPNDANPGTFYSAMSNVDLEVAEGNPAAVGVRGRYAQHCYLAHMDFRLRSGLAGIHDIGNEADDLRFFGGEYGIITRTPSPGWQFTLLDSHFEGQGKSAILTRATGLTLIRPSFRNVPTAVEVDADHSEQLWMEDARLEDVSGPALIVSRENSLRTQINVESTTCLRVPTFLRFRESGKRLPSPSGREGRRVRGQRPTSSTNSPTGSATPRSKPPPKSKPNTAPSRSPPYRHLPRPTSPPCPKDHGPTSAISARRATARPTTPPPCAPPSPPTGRFISPRATIA